MKQLDSDPILTHGLIRNWDYTSTLSVPCIVKYINPSNGVFDWSSFDKFFGSNTSKDIIFVLGQPADWMIPRAATGGASKGGKANMCPTGAELTAFVAAVTAIVQRSVTTWGRAGLKWELWNEINDTKYYNDTQSSLGPYTKAVAQAIKAVDSTAIILSPSLSYNLKSSAQYYVDFFNANDGSGGKAGSYCDGLSLHYYGTDTPAEYVEYVDAANTSQKFCGFSLPIWVTESGVNVEPANYPTLLKRRMLVFAGLGCKCFVGYASDYEVTALDNATYAGPWNAMAAIVPGSTIANMVKNPDSTVTAIVNGSSLTV